MSFQRVNPGGYGTGSIVHSGAFNQLDDDHAKALDKSVAGDQLQGTITMDTGGRIQASVPGGLQSTVPGGFALTGGATDWQTFGVSGSVPRGRTIRTHVMPYPALATGWTAGAVVVGGFGSVPIYAIAGPANAVQPQLLQMPRPHNSAVLASVTMHFAVVDVHASGAPATPPILSIAKLEFTGPAYGTSTTLATGSPTLPATGAAWYAGGNLQSWTLTPNASIDTANFVYVMVLTDESGTHSAPGNTYLGMTFVFTQITNMAFP